MPDQLAYKTEIVSVRMSPDELRAVAKRADDCGKCLSTYMRIVALGSIPRARPRRIEEKAVYQLGKIGNNLLCAAAHNNNYVQRPVMWS